MRLREFEGVVSKRDVLMIDPRTIKVRPGFNVRDLTTPEARAKLDILKSQIKEQGGVRKPIEVSFDGYDPFVTDGHRRLKAVMELIAEGEDIRAIPAIQEDKGTNDAGRVLVMLTAPGEPLAPLEFAAGVKLLVGYGWDKANVAKQLGFRDKSSVDWYLDMLAMPEAVQTMVKNGDVAATTALREVRKNGSEAAVTNITKAKEDAKAAGKPKVTPKRLERSKAPEPKADPEPDRIPVHASSPAPERPGPEDIEQISAAFVQEPLDETNLAVLQDHLNTYRGEIVPMTPAPGAIKELIETLRPFARYAHLNDLNEREDDDAIEVPVRDLKRAAVTFAKITGGMEP